MGRRDIQKYSPAYQLVLLFAEIYHRLYYKRFSVKGRRNIPGKAPIMFAGTHQNALMDPLAVIFALRRQVVFFARADIFRKKSIARMLYFLKVLPVYRPRDGFRSVEQNQEVFEEGIKVLQYKCPVGILPEGNHVGEKRLRPLRKGAARLALFAEAACDFKLGLKIIPVGIDYSDYFKAGADLLVLFGESIEVSQYQEQYIENQPQAINRLKDDIAEALRKVMIDIRPQEYYQAIHLASEIYAPVILQNNVRRSTLYQEYLAKKQLTEKLNEKAEIQDEHLSVLKKLTEEYQQKIDKNRIRDWLVRKGKVNKIGFILQALTLLILLPAHIYGIIMNYMPYRLPSFISKNIKDPHLVVSVRFGAGFLLFFLCYLIIAIAICFLFPGANYYKAIFLLSLPCSGIFSFYYFRMILKMKGKWRWMSLKRRDIREYEKIISLRDEIIKLVSLLMK